MSVARKKKDDLDFEASLKKLEEIVRRLEDEQAPLEESLGLFAEGKALAKACEAQLQKAENRVRLLIEGAEGQLEEAPLDGVEAASQPENEEAKSKDDIPF